jgi:hypothetical protein
LFGTIFVLVSTEIKKIEEIKMKRPLVYGLTALCVLSSPTLISEFKNPTFTKVYRSIASSEVAEFVEKLDAANEETITSYQNQMKEKLESFKFAIEEHQKLKSREDFKDLPELEINNLKKEETRLLAESKKISEQIQTGIKKLSSSTAQEIPSQFLIQFNSLERDLNNIVITNPISEKPIKKVVQEEASDSTNTDEKKSVVTTSSDTNKCESVDPIAELQAQVKELLEDKEKALAKVEEEKKKKKERQEKIKKAQEIYALGMIFRQGFMANFSSPMFNFQHPMSQFSMQSQFSNFVRPSANPWMSLMNNYFSGRRTTASVINNNYFGEAPSRNNVRSLAEESRSYIPKFTRSLVEGDSISIN